MIEAGNDQGIEWLEKATLQRYADAQHSLGVLYANGEVVTQDFAKAVEWFEKSALQGHAAAQSNFAMLRDM